jgi:hypothetical protein
MALVILALSFSCRPGNTAERHPRHAGASTTSFNAESSVPRAVCGKYCQIHQLFLFG